MKKRFLAISCLCVLVLNLAGSAVADVSKRKVGSQGSQLAQLLPATDGIVTVDVRRFFSSALPQTLSANQTLLAKVTAQIDDMKAKTGIDVRQFDHLAAGITAKQISGKNYDIDPIVIARGQISSGALIGAAKLAAKGKYREENASGKTVYIFAAKDIADAAKQQVPGSAAADKAASTLSKEMAVTAIDANTIAFGELALVRQTLGVKTAASNDLIALLAKKETSVVSFAGKMPNGMSVFLPLDNDELGKNIDAIRYVYGGMDFVGNAATMSLTARTLQDTQAKALLETLEGLQMIGKAFLGGAKGSDKQVYARMIENAKFSAKANEVMLDLQVPQGDIDILVGMIR